jgi:tetratricopeptide (TPR) repeat protein
VWRTGANASTKITLNEPVHIGGKSIQTGTYALYTIPGKEMWTIIIHANTKLRSLAGDAYNQADDVFRFDVKPQKTHNYVETFTLQFSDLRSNSCNLQLVWENTLINIPIEVEVDQKIEQQITEFNTNPDNVPHRSYFEAAQYYLNNEIDLDEAILLIDAALEKSPENFRYGLLKAKIQDQGGDREAALVTIDQAHTWAKNAKNANYIEQTELFKQSLLVRN